MLCYVRAGLCYRAEACCDRVGIRAAYTIRLPTHVKEGLCYVMLEQGCV